jgi:sugar O-acyltransferase (sialic acid O-acetyltransferase NeuD family)
MVKDLVIIGAGGSGREVAEAIEDINSLGRRWNLLGFLDDDPDKQRREYNGYPVLGPISSAINYPTCQFVVVLGSHRDLRLTQRVVARLSLESSRFATIIHPSAKVSRYAEIAAGTVVLQDCIITVNTRIGKYVLIMFGVSIAHDCTIGDYVVIAPKANICGSVTIHEGCYIGASATIMQKVEVGPWSCAGMAAAVRANVPPQTTAVGNPARLLRHEAVE